MHIESCVCSLIIRDHIILMNIEYVYNLQSFRRKKGASPRGEKIIKCEKFCSTKLVFLLFSPFPSFHFHHGIMPCMSCLMA